MYNPRPEGVYCHWSTYPPEGGLLAAGLHPVAWWVLRGDGKVELMTREFRKLLYIIVTVIATLLVCRFWPI